MQILITLQCANIRPKESITETDDIMAKTDGVMTAVELINSFIHRSCSTLAYLSQIHPCTLTVPKLPINHCRYLMQSIYREHSTVAEIGSRIICGAESFLSHEAMCNVAICTETKAERYPLAGKEEQMTHQWQRFPKQFYLVRIYFTVTLLTGKWQSKN